MKVSILFILLFSSLLSRAAITVDTFLNGGSAVAGTGLTWTHVCATGAELYVAATDTGAGGIDSGVTSNGTPMTFVVRLPTPKNIAVYYLPNCTGSQSVVLTSGFGFISASSISLLGTDHGAPNASATNTVASLTAGSNYATSVTSTVNNCLTLQFFLEDFGPGAIFTAGANTSVQIANGAQGPEISSSSSAVATGVSTQNVTSNATESIWSIIIAAAPAITSRPTTQGIVF